MRRNYVFINAEGYMDIMPIAEAEAIERSGACSLWEYISTPTTWPQQTVPFVTLMEARPGATEPVELHGAWIDRNGMPWTYDELCQLLKDNPRTLTEQLQWGQRTRAKSAGRTRSTVSPIRLDEPTKNQVGWRAHPERKESTGRPVACRISEPEVESTKTNMAVVEIIENGGARLEVQLLGPGTYATITIEGEVERLTIDLDAEDLRALIRRCRAVLQQIEGKE